VGVTNECDYPPEARAKPFVSDTSLPLESTTSPKDIDRLVAERVAAGQPLYWLDQELIRSLRPELILAQDLCRVCAVPSGQVTEALEVLGVEARVLSLDPNTLEEIIADIDAVGSATGRRDVAAELVAALRARVDHVAATASLRPRVSTFAMEWPDPPFAGGHWVPEMVAAAGGRDPLGIEGAPSRRLSWAEVAAAAPEVVVAMPCGFGLAEATEQARALYERDELRDSPAVQARRVFAVDASAYFSRPGPRVVDGLEILAWILHPEQFDQPPAERVVQVA
jgi:iron complex transport system substrate-binding protein